MKVVGIDLIKLFRNFKFEKSNVILTGYMAIITELTTSLV